ncbi:hypothetical protein B0H67DRAFT_323802 [Lasiosphaeris hirsuta]|uniref:BHLH domain-containing protein n=1 Tax=Lasiosphaeris hirsuta TaxID=260670 RepID=A0AA40A216_9PEZI|nr:hypothetical protein B0H67DRAFT_323802 [Lasiosphaeris hirsuta]
MAQSRSTASNPEGMARSHSHSSGQTAIASAVCLHGVTARAGPAGGRYKGRRGRPKRPEVGGRLIPRLRDIFLPPLSQPCFRGEQWIRCSMTAPCAAQSSVPIRTMAHVLYEGDLVGWDFGDSFGLDGTIHPVQVPQIGPTSHAAPWAALAVDLSAANFGLLSPPSSGVSALSPEPDLFDLGTTTPNCALDGFDGLDAIDLALDLAHGAGGDAFAALHPPLQLDELSNVTWMHTATAGDARQAVQSPRRLAIPSPGRRGSGRPKPEKPERSRAKPNALPPSPASASPPRPASVDVDAAPASDEMVPTFAQPEPPFHRGGQPVDTATDTPGALLLGPGQSGSSASKAGMISTSISTSVSTSVSTSTKRRAGAGTSPSAKRGRTQPKKVPAGKPPSPASKSPAQAKNAARKSKSVSPARPDLPGQDFDDGPDCGAPCPTLEEYQTRMRQWHNRIGKKYRNKLNEQFESLQAVLRIESEGSGAVKSPARQQYDLDADGDYELEHAAAENNNQGVVGGGKGHVSVGGKTINKAKVLDMARRRIETLTQERETLREEKEALLDQLKARGMQVGM